MFMRIDKLQAELPEPKKPDPNAAAALQELLGGKYGEMSTLGNYMFQSFNFRNKEKLRPFYSLVSSIFAEELRTHAGTSESGLIGGFLGGVFGRHLIGWLTKHASDNASKRCAGNSMNAVCA
jgi:hypothetical protein